MPIEDIEKALRRSWSAETSYWPQTWTPERPEHGQCAVTAMIVQACLGGWIVRAKVNGKLHYWNLLHDYKEVDLTRGQFETWPAKVQVSLVDRKKLETRPDTMKRYETLLGEFLRALAFGYREEMEEAA